MRARLILAILILATASVNGQAVRIFDRLDKDLDVSIVSPTNGQLLQFNGTKWVNATVPSGTGTVTSIAITGLNGIGVAGSPITTNGTIILSLSGYVASNTAITGATKTKITFDSKGLVTAGANATTADIAASTDKQYVSDADLVKLANLSGTNTGDQDLSGLVPKTTTVNGHALSSNVAVTASDVSLGNLTNDAQTKAAIVPNTAPSAGQALIGNSGGAAYAPQTISGSGATVSMSSAGVLTISAIPNASLSNSAITIAGTSTSLGGSITLDGISGISSNGFLKRTSANTWTNDSSTYLTGNQTITLSGDVTGSGATSITTVLANIPDLTPAVGSILRTNIAAPTSPASGKVKTYSDSTDLRFHDKNSAGTIGTTIVADTGASNNFLTAVSSAGAISKAQPAIANLSDAGTLATWAGITPGTGVSTALGVNVGSAGAFVTNGGALGTPSSGTLTNATGLPITGITSSTSAQLRTLLSDENGTGVALFDGATSPTFVTPALGTPSALVGINITGTGSSFTAGHATDAASLSVSGQTGLISFTGLASTNRIKTVRDAADTILELGGSYTPTGTWTSLPLTTPKITTSLLDANGNLWIGQTATASAIFGLHITNAASAGTVTAKATIPTQAASGIAGTPLTIGGSDAVAGSSNAGAVVGGSVIILAGDAKRLTSGNAVGGDVTLTAGRSIGSGNEGNVFFNTAGTVRMGVGYDGHSYVTSGRRFYLGGDPSQSNRGGYFYNSTNGIMFGTNGTTDAWSLTSSGHFQPQTTRTYDIGDATHTVRDIYGTATNDNAAAGAKGEYVSASVVVGSATALTTATPKTVTSISLTAGDWDVTAIGALTGASTGTEFDVAIGTTTNSLTGTVLGDTRCQTPTVSLTGADASLMVPAVRVSISSTTTYYLIVQETFTVGAPSAYGRLSARRVR